ncbi:MAG TPA: Rne/Rng family ribonuclease [Clostridiaceae bacterium]|nr:Rne/Rng family ribonuclease [Clostridiaceae bacterium]
MTSKILVDVGPRENRVALVEDNELVELYIERLVGDRLVGNIYRGKVCSVLQGMQAAFIDIGYERNAFLYVADAIPENENEKDKLIKRKGNKLAINDILKPGQEITVQVVKESIDNKGPRLTTHLTLPGRYLVLLPYADYTGVSRRIEDEEERKRLKHIIEKIKPEGMGIIARTAAEGKDEYEFVNDLNFLKKLWHTISQREQKGNVPRCIYTDLDLVSRTVRDMFTADIGRFIINDLKTAQKVMDLLDIISPSLKSRVEYFDKGYGLFDYYGIGTEILRALSKKVWLKCGGYLIIEATEALTVIDVNTGKYVGGKNLEETVVRTNLEAAAEIARQLRLRDIGGIIIIDFIDMYEQEHQQLVINELKKALKKDRTKTAVIGLTGLGLVEMTRKKVRQPLDSIMYTDCPNCHGTGKILNESQMQIKEIDSNPLVC